MLTDEMWNRKGRVKDVSMIFGLSNWKDAVAKYWGGEDHSGGSQLSTFKDPCNAGSEATALLLILPLLFKKGYPIAPIYTSKSLQSYPGYFAFVGKFQLEGLTKKQKNQQVL